MHVMIIVRKGGLLPARYICVPRLSAKTRYMCVPRLAKPVRSIYLIW